MLHTKLCDLFGIEHPIILAPMGSATSADFAAAMSIAGGLGGIGTFSRARADILEDLSRIRRLTDRPFNVNHVPQAVDEAVFAETLRLRPTVISFSLGDPGEMVEMAKAAGSTVMLQVTTVEQARIGAERAVATLRVLAAGRSGVAGPGFGCSPGI